MPAGRPKTTFTPGQLDRAKELLGRRVYPSRVAGELEREFGLSLEMAYKLIAAAQKAVYDDLRGRGHAGDPLTAQYLFLVSVIADDAARTQDKIQASHAVVKLLGLNKLFDQLGADGAEEYLAGLVARRARRKAADDAPPDPPP